MKSALLSVAVMALASAAVAQEETTMAMEDVPAAVMEAAMANAMDVTFDTVAMDEGVYEFAGTMEDGMGLEIDVMEDGSIEEVEKQIAMEALPAEVMATLEAELAGFEPTYIEESTRSEGVIVYEFEGMVDGAEIDAEINADGTGFSSNLDAAG